MNVTDSDISLTCNVDPKNHLLSASLTGVLSSILLLYAVDDQLPTLAL